ncbi:xanthine dehydrogenase accessory protein XdhC [Massilia sp. PWRC2]|uniref:xanthine dehydrogenase accessory protein XdhC n=1 Tax=Massilia sp. PWRC2 TaxID=2804626 RepID=UPI003CE892FD
MIDEWMLAASTSAVLVTVAIAEGSVPREAGARMVVVAAAAAAPTLAGTIGGGHLELRAIEIARQMLAEGCAYHLERFALGPSLGQCCGGVVHLAFELLDPAAAQLLAGRRWRDSWRVLALDPVARPAAAPAPAAALFDEHGALLCGDAIAFDRQRGSHVMVREGRRYLVAKVAAPPHHVMLFGAGHVGAALVAALAPLPCTVTWIDQRADLFPTGLPDNVQVEATDAPEDLVASAPNDASYLVMTHSHALDQRLCEAILARQQVRWLGLIGSHTKRAQFEHRLRARGFDDARIDAMACPIGLPGISGKQPAVIAAAVVAQLLLRWHAAGNT